MNILALSGSLRAQSVNTASLRALQALAAKPVRIDLVTTLAQIPPFNPDADTPDLPPAVRALREAVGRAQGLIIASPEYAHGVSGVLKNALDWLVSSEEFYDKPVALLNMSHRASHADAQLREILRTMSARLNESASRTIPLRPQHRNTATILADDPLVMELRAVLHDFVQSLA